MLEHYTDTSRPNGLPYPKAETFKLTFADICPGTGPPICSISTAEAPHVPCAPCPVGAWSRNLGSAPRTPRWPCV